MTGMSKDTTPAGTFMKNVWDFCKKHAVTFAVGVASGVGITLAVQTMQNDQQEIFVTVGNEDEVTIQ